MVAGNALGVLRCGTLLAAVLALAGCPIPLPTGYQASSRENLPAEPLDWVTVGVTTREDVLLKLGEPDGEAPDGSWLAYGSAYSKGGVLFMVFAGGSAAGAGGETVQYHRLIIAFDDRGVVSAMDPVSRDCWESIVGAGSFGAQTPPCLKIGSRE